MQPSDSFAKFCEICSKLDTQRLAHPLHPCPKSSTCSEAPIERGHTGGYLELGSMDEIKSRRSACDICKLVAECLDREPSDLTGDCRITETGQFCTFNFPSNIKPDNPSTTHFHITQASVIFDPLMADQYYSPPLPWEVKTRSERSSHHVLHFQTRATSCYEPNLATLQTEQGFLETVGGRYVGTEIDTQLVRRWVRECECEHGRDCMPSMQLLAERYKGPTFVIDVIESCLVNTPSQCRYVALSYVWGTAIVFKHLLENTQQLRRTSSLRSLPIPATIRDAMTLVHAIGERYLWVDSVCIIQDDVQMRQTEIMCMGSIYSGALFTIIAATGNSANSGLAGVRKGSREQAQKILRLADCELLTVIDTIPSGIDNTIWSQRAWTFQERALSTRALVFSEHQIYWICRGGSHSEERALEQVRGVDQIHLPFTQKQAADSLSWKSLEPLEYCSLYKDLLSNYRQRGLTFQTDILNAFNGVTEMLATVYKDTFLWGLPESYFSYAITWMMTGRYSRTYTEVPVLESSDCQERIPIPSWSWAAWSGQGSRHLSELYDRKNDFAMVPLIRFSIVNNKRQLVAIKERQWQDDPGDPDHTLSQDPLEVRARTLSQNAPPYQPVFPPHPHLQIGHLCFWSSHAKVKAIKMWGVGVTEVSYELFPPPDFQPNPNSTLDRSDIVHQDFIVIAARRPEDLALLAVEWKDDVAYRVGTANVAEADWNQIENRQWRLITLG